MSYVSPPAYLFFVMLQIFIRFDDVSVYSEIIMGGAYCDLIEFGSISKDLLGLFCFVYPGQVRPHGIFTRPFLFRLMR